MTLSSSNHKGNSGHDDVSESPKGSILLVTVRSPPVARAPSRRSVFKSISQSAVFVRSFIKRSTRPSHVREKRDRERRRNTGGQRLDEDPQKLCLHVLCGQPFVTLEELHECLSANPDSIQARDTKGRYPLHVIGDYEDIISSSNGKQIARAFATHLMQEFPDAITASDNNGLLPFFSIIADWITDVNSEKKVTSSSSPTDEISSISNISAYYPGKSGMLQSSSSSNSKAGYFFPRVEFWDEVLWCFEMLSTAMEVLGRNFTSPSLRTTLAKRSHHRSDERTLLVQKLATMPNLVRSVLLVDDDASDSRSKVLGSMVFRRLLLCPLIIDKWLVRMLKHGGVPSQRGLNFLWLISNTKIQDYTGGVGTLLASDWAIFHQSKECVFDTVGQLKGKIASLVALDKDQLERAASTSVTCPINYRARLCLAWF
ncbi:hypothetical protein ACA910_022689 [Epithemia clementina (nom. ined.)]